MAARVMALILLFCMALAIASARAQQPKDTPYEVTGTWSGQNIHVTEVKPGDRNLKAPMAQVSGAITAADLGEKRFHIGPIEVQWSESTSFEGMTPGSLDVGTTIEVTGRIIAPRRLLAISIKPGPAFSDSKSLRVVGTLTGLKKNIDGSASFAVMGVAATLPADIYRRLGDSLPEPEEEDVDATTAWEIEGEYEVKLDFRKNFALDKRNRDDLFRFDQEFQTRWSYRYKDWLSFLVEGKLIGEHQLYTGGGGRRSEFDPERGETWVRFDKLFGRDLSLQIGRQPFEEPRRWWWDDELDAVAMRYQRAPWSFEFGLARELLQESLRDNFIDPENDRVIRVLARASWLYSKNHGLDLFFLHHNDRSATPSVGASVKRDREDPSDARLWWGGLRATGSQPAARYGELSYWTDVAIVLGKEKLLELSDAPGNQEVVDSRGNQRVRGWAIDLGGRWESELPGQPLFTIAYAVGSGDKNPGRGSDRAYRQTGLQAGDEEFRTYGELLQPELSNLSIPAVAVRFPIFSRSHVEFAYRHFRQIHAVPFLREARIEAEPNGINKNIGHEWMLYSIIKQWKNIEIEMVGAAFRAGHAYGALSGKMAYSLFTKVTYEF
jgi:alginate production protein